jgi:hypothetical protein
MCLEDGYLTDLNGRFTMTTKCQLAIKFIWEICTICFWLQVCKISSQENNNNNNNLPSSNAF